MPVSIAEEWVKSFGIDTTLSFTRGIGNAQSREVHTHKRAPIVMVTTPQLNSRKISQASQAFAQLEAEANEAIAQSFLSVPVGTDKELEIIQGKILEARLSEEATLERIMGRFRRRIGVQSLTYLLEIEQ